MAFDRLMEFIFGLDAKRAFEQREAEINNFRKRVINVIDGLLKESKTEVAKRHLRKIRQTVETARIYGFPAQALRRAGKVVTLGENVSTYLRDAKTGRVIEAGPNFINLPQMHVFYNNKLTAQGAMTLAHEMAHGSIKNEEMADLVAVRIASRAGIPKQAAYSHFAGREIVIGRKGIENALKRIEYDYAEAEKKFGKIAKPRIAPRPPRRPIPAKARQRFRPRLI